MEKSLKITLFYVVTRKKEFLEIDNIDFDKTTMMDLFRIIQKKLYNETSDASLINPITGTFCRYYKFVESTVLDEILPFIIKNNKVLLNVPYDDCTIADFLNTHNLVNEIHIEYHTQCGGIGPILVDWWNYFFSFISTLSTIHFGYFQLKRIAKKIKDRHNNMEDEIHPLCYPEFIFSRDSWNRYRLAEMLNIDIDEALFWLEICGYERDHGEEYLITRAKKEKMINRLEEFITYTIKNSQR